MHKLWIFQIKYTPMPRDPLVPAVPLGKVLCQVYEHLPADHLVTVHIPHKLEHWLHQTSLVNVGTQFDVRQVSPLH